MYQIAPGYEDCNDAAFLRIDPALRVAIGRDDEAGASRPMLSRLEQECRIKQGGGLSMLRQRYL